VRVAQLGEHGGGAEWWLGARARVQGARLASLAARLGRGGAGLRLPGPLNMNLALEIQEEASKKNEIGSSVFHSFF
jgi:hypothetical protein